MNKKSLKQCVFCGKNTHKITQGHAPPKNIFPKPWPSNLITAPECEDCNKAAEKDDDYFRLILLSRHDIARHPEALKILPKVLRSLEREEAVGLRKKFEKSLKVKGCFTPEGVYLGDGVTYLPETERIYRVLIRTIKALYFKHSGKQRLPDWVQVNIVPTEEISFSEDDAQQYADLLIEADAKHNQIGNEVLSYWYIMHEQEYVSTWLFVFFERYEVIGRTKP